MANTIRCTACGDENPADARFCIDCGASLVPVAIGETTRLPGVRCPGCGSSNPEHARFCVVCGRGFSTSTPPQPLPQSQPAPQPAPRQRPPISAPPYSPRQHSYPRVDSTPTPTPIAPVPPRQMPQQPASWDPKTVVPLLFVGGMLFLLMRGSIWPGILWLIGISSFIGAMVSNRGHKAFAHLVWWGGLALLFATKAFWPGILILIFLCMMINGRNHRSGWW